MECSFILKAGMVFTQDFGGGMGASIDGTVLCSIAFVFFNKEYSFLDTTFLICKIGGFQLPSSFEL